MLTRILDELDLSGTRVETVLRVTDKSVLAAGHREGRAVVIKALRSTEGFWRDKLTHEIGIYRALAQTPAPPRVRTPELVHTDGERVLVIEHLPGHPLDAERYLTAPVADDDLAAVIAAVTGFSAWAPPAGVLVPVFDYPDRLRRYGHLLDLDTRATLHRLITDLGRPTGPVAVAHGDPLPANLLLPATTRDGAAAADGAVALVDFEFTGLFLPGFDLAMLHALLAATPGADRAVREAAAEAGVDERALLVNRAIVLTRELRIHRELDDGPLRRDRLALIEPLLHALADELREHC